MRHWYDVVFDTTGKPLSGATVTVYSPPGQTSTKATIYSDDGITPTANPVTTDQYGRFNFYIADGRYDLAAAFTNGSYTQSDVEISDVTEASSSDSAWKVESGGLKIVGSSSGTITLAVPAAAGSNTWTFPAATDQSVGQSTTDTLKNKTLTGASNGNSVTLLNFQGPLSPITGTGAAATYFTYSLPANTMAAGRGIRITAVTRHSTGSSGSCLMSVSFGGTSTTTMGDDAGATTAITKIVYEIWNNGGTSSQVMVSDLTRGGAGTAFVRFDTASINTTSSVTINAQFNVANTDAITPEMFMVELIQ